MKTKNLLSSQTALWISIATFAGLLIYILSFDWMSPTGFWEYRRTTTMGTGVIAFALMSLCMITAIRSKKLEKYWNGLDKMFHLHKWSAIFAFTWTIIHWVTERGVKLLAQSQLVEFPPKVKPVHAESAGFSLQSLEEPAKIFGEYSFYILIAFILCALLSKIPYSIFQKMHRFIAVLYILFAFHSIVLMPQTWWSTPAAYLIVALAIMGTYGAISSLFKTHRKKHSHQATVESIQTTETGIIDLTLKMNDDKPFQYESGQFAFIDFTPVEGPHPFTIAAVTPDGLRFAIKPSGDFTGKMTDLVQTGQTVVVEGPYGNFDFETAQPRQIWVAGGIGIAPFISQLQALAQKPEHNQSIDFWYSTVTEEENNFPETLEELCEKANVKLHRVVTNKNGYLDATKITQKIGDDQLQQSSVWFCGPQKFGSSLKAALTRLGLAKNNFHNELFCFR